MLSNKIINKIKYIIIYNVQRTQYYNTRNNCLRRHDWFYYYYYFVFQMKIVVTYFHCMSNTTVWYSCFTKLDKINKTRFGDVFSIIIIV